MARRDVRPSAVNYRSIRQRSGDAASGLGGVQFPVQLVVLVGGDENSVVTAPIDLGAYWAQRAAINRS